MSNDIRTRTSVYSQRADGIIVQRNLPGVAQSLADARENIAAFTELADGHKHALLVDARAIHSQEAGVRELYSGPEAMRWTSAIAILTNSSGAGRVIANLFLAMSSPTAPTRLFADEDLAIAWLLKISRALASSAAR